MSTPQHPVGRRSPAVYRRRRLMVLLALIAIIVLVVLAIARPWRGSAKPGAAQASVPAAAASASPSPTLAGTAATTSSPTPSVSAKPSPKPTASVTPAADSPCNPAVVDVEAITDASSYGPTQRPLLSLSITNTSSQLCTIDAGTAAMVFTISSGSDQWWTSTDCQTDPVHTVIKLEPHKTLTSVPIAWDRTRSSKTTCSSKSRPKAPAGGASYHLAVAVDGIASKTTKQFILNG